MWCFNFRVSGTHRCFQPKGRRLSQTLTVFVASGSPIPVYFLKRDFHQTSRLPHHPLHHHRQYLGRCGLCAVTKMAPALHVSSSQETPTLNDLEDAFFFRFRGRCGLWSLRREKHVISVILNRNGGKAKAPYRYATVKMELEFSTAFTTPSSTILKNRSIEASPFEAFEPEGTWRTRS